MVIIIYHESSRPEVFCKKFVRKNLVKFRGKHLFLSLFFNEAADWRPATLGLLKKTLTQVFSYECYTVFKNTFSIEHLRLAPETICTKACKLCMVYMS